MGCGSMKEKIENEMIAMKMERVTIQMERKNQIKLLEEIDGRKIIESKIPDYLVATPEKNELIPKERSKSMDITKKLGTDKTYSSTRLKGKIRTKRSKKTFK